MERSIKPNVFIVDDNASFRKILKVYLKMKNSVAVAGEASNGQEFLDVFNDYNIDIVLLDLNMPIMNGIETAKTIDQWHTNQIKVIALTENDDINYMKSMIEAGASGYVVKSDMGTHLEIALNKVTNGEYYFPGLSK